MAKNYYVSGNWNTTKTCSVCKEEKDLSLFYKQKDGKYGVTSRCKCCVLASNAKYTSPEKSRQYTENWRNKNNNRELSRQGSRTWRKNTLEYDAFRSATYRASRLQRTPAWANLNDIKEIYQNCPKGFHVDHIIPLRGTTVSGLHVKENLQYLSAIDNIRKRNIYHE